MIHSPIQSFGNSAATHASYTVALLVLILIAASSSGCDQIRSYLQPADERDSSLSPTSGSVESGQSPSLGHQSTTRREIPLPSMNIELEPGSLVLAPRPQTSVNSIAEGILNKTVYDVQRVIRVEGDQVFLEAPLAEEHAVNAALVLPVSTRDQARAGDRIVVPAGGRLAVGIVRNSERRKLTAIVRSQRMQIRYELKPNRYYLVDPDSVVGHFAHCDSGSRIDTHLVIQESDGLYVTLASHGAVSVFRDSECNILPLESSTEVGDTVRAELLGSIRDARVERIDRTNESIDVSYAWRGERRNDKLSFGLFAPMEPESLDTSAE